MQVIHQPVQYVQHTMQTSVQPHNPQNIQPPITHVQTQPIPSQVPTQQVPTQQVIYKQAPKQVVQQQVVQQQVAREQGAQQRQGQQYRGQNVQPVQYVQPPVQHV